MTLPPPAETFRRLCCNPAVLDFASATLTEAYCTAAPDHEQPMRALMDAAFALLRTTAADPARFATALHTLSNDWFAPGGSQPWFKAVYLDYKQCIKPPVRYARLGPHLRGQAVLDFGCGNGLTALILAQNGWQVQLADVLDYRSPAARGLPFTPLGAETHLPSPDNAFDTALVFAVLHHVQPAALLPLVGELRRVSRRVIVEEDSYGIPPGQPVPADARLAAFMALPLETQRQVIMLIDYFGNILNQGIGEMDMPFGFRPVGEWQALFAAQGFTVTQTIVQGFQRGLFNQTCHVWFVLD